MKRESKTSVGFDETELQAAELEAEMNEDKPYIHRFSKPFVYEGKTHESLTFDWYKLTGRDSLAIENEMSALGKALIIPEFSGEYLIRMAARACTEKIGSDTIEAMPLVDCNKIRNNARSFLLKSGQ